MGIIVEDAREFVLSLLGAMTAGVVPVPIYPAFSFKEMSGYCATVRHIVQTAGAETVLASPTMRQHLEGAPALSGLTRWLALEDLSVDAEFRPLEIAPSDVAFLQFTSGSTSQPKGVVVTHDNLRANSEGIMVHGINSTPADIGVSWLPLWNHDMGLIGFVFAPIFANVQVVLMHTATFARRPWSWLETISRNRGTITYAPNFAYNLIARRARDRDLAGIDLSSLRIAGCGAEPIHARTLHAFAERMKAYGFRREAFVPSYGMAEATLAISIAHSPREPRWLQLDADALRADTVKRVERVGGVDVVNNGPVLPGHEVRIVSVETGDALGEEQIGEITVRGPSITSGYFRAPEQTALAFRDGWLRTGDLGFLSAGDVYVCGRLKDLIIVRGRNHFPQDIEWIVAEVEGVRRGNAVAFSTTDSDGDEQLVVVAEALSSEAAGLPERIASAVLQSAGVSPWQVVLVAQGSIPKTSSGKPQRRKTRELFATGGLQRVREGAKASRRPLPSKAEALDLGAFCELTHAAEKEPKPMPHIYGLDDAAQKLVAQAKSIRTDVLAKHAVDVDSRARFPSEGVKALADAGLMGICVPTTHGGMGQAPRTFAAVAEELAQGCASTAMIFVMHVSAQQAIGARRRRSASATRS